MAYAIIGSGNIGSALARQFARKGINVLVANSRGPASLAGLVAELGPTVVPATLEQALAADLVILAVPFPKVPDAVRGAGPWQGRVVVDATNAIDYPAFTPKDLGGRLSSAIVAEAVPGARLVKAFNTLPAAVLAQDPASPGGRRVVFLSGDDRAANADVAGLVDRLGFAPIDLGSLAAAGPLQQFGGPLMVHDLLKRG